MLQQVVHSPGSWLAPVLSLLSLDGQGNEQMNHVTLSTSAVAEWKRFLLEHLLHPNSHSYMALIFVIFSILPTWSASISHVNIIAQMLGCGDVTRWFCRAVSWFTFDQTQSCVSTQFFCSLDDYNTQFGCVLLHFFITLFEIINLSWRFVYNLCGHVTANVACPAGLPSCDAIASPDYSKHVGE